MENPLDKFRKSAGKAKLTDKSLLRGEEVNKFITDLFHILKAKVEVPDVRQMDIYSSIVDMQNDEYLSDEVSNLIKDELAELALQDTLFAHQVMRTAVGGITKDNHPAVTTPHYVDDWSFPVTSGDEAEGLPGFDIESPGFQFDSQNVLKSDEVETLQTILGENPNQAKVLEGLEYVKGLIAERKKSILPPSSPSDGSGGPTDIEIDPFTNNALTEEELIASIFSQVGSLEDSNFDALRIHTEMDIMYRRLISLSLKITKNRIDNIDQFMNKIVHYRNDSNEYKSQLWEKMNRLMVIVKRHNVDSMGLVMPSTFTSLRLSQVVVNQVLKDSRYVFDASACSSGKLTTCILAPAEVEAKRSILIAENSTYGDMVKTAKEWYSKRDDFVILDKKDLKRDGERCFSTDKNVIVVLDKAYLARINSQNPKVSKKFESLIDKAQLDLLVADEAHNFKGNQQANAAKIDGGSDSDDTDDAHNNVSWCLQTMAVRSKYRLFASATPLLNDFSEITRLLQFLLPTTPTDKNFLHQERLATIQDSAKKVEGIMKNAYIIYSIFQAVSIRVPRPDVEYDIQTISNKGIGITASGNLRKSKSWKDEWSREIHSLVEERGTDKNWGDLEKDEIFFPYYIAMMSKQLVSALKNGDQICLYTNNSLQSHEELKEMILDLTSKAGIQLNKDEVVCANGSTSSDLRKNKKVKLDDGTTTSRTKLATMVWDKSCKVLIANNVCSVGLDGLQGTDKIKGCGRISKVFLLANSWTESIQYQFFSRFVRTQGESDQLPDVTFYQPEIHFNANQPDDDIELDFCRTQYTNNRLLIKKVKADLVVDGKFPKGIDIDSLNATMTNCALAQLAKGIHDTQEALEERGEVRDRSISKIEGGV